jgi:hypothetical protein
LVLEAISVLRRKSLSARTGMTPGEYRDRFSQMSFDRGELMTGRLNA